MSPLAATNAFNAAVLPLSAARWMAFAPCRSRLISESMLGYIVVSGNFSKIVS
jgi:hypothetical protein